MLDGQRAHRFQEVPLGIVSLLGGRADVRGVRIGALGEGGEAPCEQARSRGHGELKGCRLVSYSLSQGVQ